MATNPSPLWFQPPNRSFDRRLRKSESDRVASRVPSTDELEWDSEEEEDPCSSEDHPATIFRNFRRTMSRISRPSQNPDEQYYIHCERADQQLQLSKTLLALLPESDYVVVAPNPGEIALGALEDAEAALRLRPNSEPALGYKSMARALERQFRAAKLAQRKGKGQDGPAAKEGREGSCACDRLLGRDWRENLLADLECPLCLKLFLNPLTTPCGHSFCAGCLSLALRRGERCPTCRRELPGVAAGEPDKGANSPWPEDGVALALAPSVALQTVLERLFPAELALRRAEEAEDAALRGAPLLPLFAMMQVLPGEHMNLNIFEPRLQVMVRTCLRGSRVFGMVGREGGAPRGELLPTGCEVRITECVGQANGRLRIHVVGTRRFALQGTQESEGLLCTRPRWLRDDAPDDEDAEALAETAREVERKADAWIGRVRVSAQSLPRLSSLLDALDGRPRLRGREYLGERLADDAADALAPSSAPTKLEAFSFWAAALVVHLADQPQQQRRVLMDLRDTHERLRVVSVMLSSIHRRYLGGGCCLG